MSWAGEWIYIDCAPAGQRHIIQRSEEVSYGAMKRHVAETSVPSLSERRQLEKPTDCMIPNMKFSRKGKMMKTVKIRGCQGSVGRDEQTEHRGYLGQGKHSV